MSKQQRGKASGQALTEFALIIGVLLLLIFVILEASRILWGWVTVQQAAREGARYAITGRFEPEFVTEDPEFDARVASIKNVTRSSLAGLPLSEDAPYGGDYFYGIEVWSTRFNAEAGQTELVEDFAGLPGEPVLVRVTYFVPIITPLLRPIVEAVPVFGQVVMTNELFSQQGGFNQGVGLPADLPTVPTPGPPPTPTPLPPCYVDILPNAVADTQTSVVVSGDIDTVVTLYELNPNDGSQTLVAGPLTLTESTIGTCPGAALFNWSGSYTLTADRFLLAESSDTSIDTALIYSASSPEADVSVTKSSLPDPVTVGEELLYTITVQNNGPAAATSVVMTDTLPANVIFTSVAPSQGGCNALDGNRIVCNLGTLVNGSNATVTIAVNPTAVGTIANTVTVSANQPDPVPQNNTATENTEVIVPVATADLAVSKTASPEPVLIGGDLTYLITVRNNGPMTATEVTVYDSLPASVNLVSVTPSVGTCQQLTTVIRCDLGTLLTGANASISIVVNPTVAGRVTNVAIVWGNVVDPDVTNNRAEVETVVTTSEPHILLNPSCGPAGTENEITVTGANWPNGNTTIYWNGVDRGSTPNLGTFTLKVTAGSGIHQVRAVRGNTGVEATAEFTIPCPIPDLVISPITVLSPLPLYEGDTGEFRVVISNEGTIDVDAPFLVSLYLDPDPPPDSSSTHIPIEFRKTSTVVNGLAVGASRTITMAISTGFTGVMTHTVYAVVDSDPGPTGLIGESNERNNVSSPRVIAPPAAPDLVIGRPVLLNPLPINAYEPVSFRLTFTNTGQVNASNQFFVGLYFDPVPAPITTTTHISSEFRVAMSAVSGLAQGASKTVTMTVATGFDGAGNHAVYGVVDSDPPPAGVIAEPNERNNVSPPLNVEAQPAPPPPPTPVPPTGTGTIQGIAHVWLNGTMNPQFNVQVKAYHNHTSLVGTTYTNVSGIYRLDNLPPGSYTVTGCVNIDGKDYFGANTNAVVANNQTTIVQLYLFAGTCS